MLLNPALVRDTTDPAGPHSLAIPVSSVAAFRTALAATPKEERAPWSQITVARGDTLSTIAERHGISVRQLRKTNNLQSDTIRVGQQLRIPGQQTDSSTGSTDARTEPGSSPRPRTSAPQRETHGVSGPQRRQPVDDCQQAQSHGQSPSAMERIEQAQGLAPRTEACHLAQWIKHQSHAAGSRSSSSNNSSVHLVRTGDNLWSIAKRYQLRSADLARWNDIKTTDTLRPGQKTATQSPRRGLKLYRQHHLCNGQHTPVDCV